jgi:uncharacterized lipoprotein NlpE involved in copper resistance
MKKAVVIALALVMVALFAGCGLQSQLAGTKWEQVQKDGKKVITLSFERFNKFNFDVKMYEDGELVEDESFSNTGKWTVDGDILTLKYDDDLEDEVYRVEIDGDTLKLFDEGDDTTYYPFTRVTE